MTEKTLKDLREKAKLDQREMADLMGIGRTAYQELESGEVKFKLKHQIALERISLRLAVERGDLNLALPAVRRDALDFTRLVTGGEQ